MEIGKCWNFCAQCQIDQKVEIWVQNIKVMICVKKQELIIDQNVEIWEQNEERSKCWNFSAKWQIDHNVEIWVQNIKLIKMAQNKWTSRNQSKCWNLSEKNHLEIQWVKSLSLIRMLKFEDKVGNQMRKFEYKNVKIDWTGRNRSKCWNLSGKFHKLECWNSWARLGIYHNVVIQVKK